MSDRELLELAAKAAGIKWDDEGSTEECLRLSDPDYPTGNVWWNPFDDDADAFRLAVKLRIQVSPGEWLAEAEELCGAVPYEEGFDDADNDSARCAATRRAIVRAAAAMVTR